MAGEREDDAAVVLPAAAARRRSRSVQERHGRSIARRGVAEVEDGGALGWPCPGPAGRPPQACRDSPMRAEAGRGARAGERGAARVTRSAARAAVVGGASTAWQSIRLVARRSCRGGPRPSVCCPSGRQTGVSTGHVGIHIECAVAQHDGAVEVPLDLGVVRDDDDGVALAVELANRSMTSTVVSLSSAPVGSSARMSGGSLTSAGRWRRAPARRRRACRAGGRRGRRGRRGPGPRGHGRASRRPACASRPAAASRSRAPSGRARG